jgi:hypothetical protein
MKALRARCVATMKLGALRRTIAGTGIALFLLMVTPSSASATSIGSFAFDVNEFGPFFTVTNYSDTAFPGLPGADFTSVQIRLFAGGVSGTQVGFPFVLNADDPFDDDAVVPGGGRNTLADLTSLVFDSATLSFGFAFALPGTVTVDGLIGLPGLCVPDGCVAGGQVTPLVSTIEFTPAAIDPTPVPEPATLLLVGTGVWAAVRRRHSTVGSSVPSRSLAGAD